MNMDCMRNLRSVSVVRLAIVLVSVALWLVLTPVPQAMADTESSAPTRKIDIVYDTSGSMIYDYDNDEALVDSWCQAKYSVEVVAGMLGETSTMTIYDTSASNPPLVQDLSGSTPISERISTIHDMIPDQTGTEIAHVREAAADLAASDADQKWLVIFTDGELFDKSAGEKDPLPNPMIGRELAGFTEQGINVVFLSIGEGYQALAPEDFGGVEVISLAEAEPQVVAQGGNGSIYLAHASDSSEILSNMQAIASLVSGRHTILSGSTENSFTTNTSMTDVVVFAQGTDVQVGNLTGPDGTTYSPESNQVSYSEVPSPNQKQGEALVDESLRGVVATYRSDEGFSAGEYKLDVSGADVVSVYYQPNVDVMLALTDQETGVTRRYGAGEQDILISGTSEAHFGLYDGMSGERIGDISQLGDVSYSATIAYDGEDAVTIKDGDSVSLREGTVDLGVSATIFGDTTVSQNYSGVQVYPPLKISVTPTTGEIDEHKVNPPSFRTGNAEDQVYAVTITNEDGSQMSEEQWAALEPLKITSSNPNITWVQDESNNPTVTFHPEFTPATWYNRLPWRFWEVIKPIGDATAGVDATMFYDDQLGVGHADVPAYVKGPTGVPAVICWAFIIFILGAALWILLYILFRKRMSRVEGIARYEGVVADVPMEAEVDIVFKRKNHFSPIPFRCYETLKNTNSGVYVGQFSGSGLKIELKALDARRKKASVAYALTPDPGMGEDDTNWRTSSNNTLRNNAKFSGTLSARYDRTNGADHESMTITIRKPQRHRKGGGGKKGKKRGNRGRRR